MPHFSRLFIGLGILGILGGPGYALDNESPEGRWAMTARECRTGDTAGMFTVRLRATDEPAISAPDRYCRLDRKTDTRIGYRFYVRCYTSLDDFRSDQNAALKTVVFDAIGPERMRADGTTLYRCGGAL